MDGKRPNREDLIELARRQPEAVVDLVLALWDRVEALEAKVAELTKNSRNSSKPPSSDKGNPNKPAKRLPGSGSKRKPGGQRGHKGSNLEMRADPDMIVTHGFEDRCHHCGGNLSQARAESFERRQLFDLPPLRLEVTEHRVACGQCPDCCKPIKGRFPQGVNAPAQHGPGVKALAIYLGVYQMLPAERTSEFFGDLFDCPLSTGTLANFLCKAGAQAEPIAEDIKQAIHAGELFGADETGASFNGKNHWLHIACTERLSYYHFHPNRGFQALEDIGILSDYAGAVVHDFFQSYYRYDSCEHYLCNAHHLRDLTYIHEDMSQPWAQEMIELLLEAKKLRDRENSGGRKIGPKTIERILCNYRRILADGYLLNPEPPKIRGKRGRPKRGKALNMLDRFRDREPEVLGFFLQTGVPFDNNQAERDLRMIKAKLKISGCFRSPKAAECFANVRSVVSTARKAGRRMLETLGILFHDPQTLAENLLS